MQNIHQTLFPGRHLGAWGIMSTLLFIEYRLAQGVNNTIHISHDRFGRHIQNQTYDLTPTMYIPLICKLHPRTLESSKIQSQVVFFF